MNPYSTVPSSGISDSGSESIGVAHRDDPQIDPGVYYGKSHKNRQKYRTNSLAGDNKVQHDVTGKRARRMSHEELPSKPRKFLIDVEETMKLVLAQEDTNGDFQIHISDSGPKVFSVGTMSSNGFKSFDIRGTYMLSNLLQELALANSYHRKRIVLDESRLTENPVNRLSRFIRNAFWSGLTRRIDREGLEPILLDPKNRSSSPSTYRIYVPSALPSYLEYYRSLASSLSPKLSLEICPLPPAEEIDGEFVKSLNDKPGILALAMEREGEERLEKEEREEGKRLGLIKDGDGEGRGELRGIPFVVPGARFNELYNWDSYFISLGLLIDGKIDLAKGIVEHFIFEIKHYGKILNGNRSYYLARSQPPFLTDLSLQVYTRLPATLATKSFLRRAIKAAIKEYHTVWMSEPRLDPISGLSRYRPDGSGIPPETEASHFTHILMPYAEKNGISVLEFCEKYNDGSIKEPELDEYFLHDRAVRESGHDTTYRFEKVCANLGTVDLNSLLYKYEVDIGTAIRDHLGGELELDEEFELSQFPFGEELEWDEDFDNNYDVSKIISMKNLADPKTGKLSSLKRKQTPEDWFSRADRRKALIDRYLWHEGKGMYFDYDTVLRKQCLYESATTFWPMWAGCCGELQARKNVTVGLSKLEVLGGLVSGTEASRGAVGLDRPNRQWE